MYYIGDLINNKFTIFDIKHKNYLFFVHEDSNYYEIKYENDIIMYRLVNKDQI